MSIVTSLARRPSELIQGSVPVRTAPRALCTLQCCRRLIPTQSIPNRITASTHCPHHRLSTAGKQEPHHANGVECAAGVDALLGLRRAAEGLSGSKGSELNGRQGAEVEGHLSAEVGGLAALDQGQGGVIPVAVACRVEGQGGAGGQRIGVGLHECQQHGRQVWAAQSSSSHPFGC